MTLFYIFLGLVVVGTLVWAFSDALFGMSMQRAMRQATKETVSGNRYADMFRDGASLESIELDDSNMDQVITAYQMQEMVDVIGANYDDAWQHRPPGEMLSRVDKVMKEAAQRVWEVRRAQEAERAKANLPMCPECEIRQVEPPDYLCRECR
jgi:hypothetical protein